MRKMRAGQQIKWGMIGTGNVTELKSGPAFSKIPGSKLVAVGNRTPKKAEDYARRHGIASCHPDPMDVIRDSNVDAVYIATPPESHPEYALATIAAGKPVYIEKPMARTHEECRVINETAEKAGVPVYVAYYRRSLDYFLKVKEIIDNGNLGKVLHINMQQYFPAREEDLHPDSHPWRIIPELSGGGYFHDVGCHALDIIFFLFGNPVNVTGHSLNTGGFYEADDTVGALITLTGKIMLNGSWSFITPEPQRTDRVEITCEMGRLSFSVFSFESIRLTFEGKDEVIDIPPPEHIQMPLITSIVNEMNGKGHCPSTGISAALTSRVMDQITAM
ncbi:MAG: Gfo/Idh/MocA family oxidoreductase [Bacteroidetes bacterium]|nr:Gfo/Idh/MocA family oxidoreductase [Bacteroidota bacterium]